MLVIFRSFFLVYFIREIECLSSPQPVITRSRSHKSYQLPEYLIFETPPSPTTPLCERLKIIQKSADVHKICNEECEKITKAIKEMHTRYQCKPVELLYNRCGHITKGICSFFVKEYFPVCNCLTPIGQGRFRSNYEVTCRYGIPTVRNLMNAAVYAKHREMTLKKKETKPASPIRQS